MPPKLDRFAGTPSGPGGSAPGQPPRPEAVPAKCTMCGTPIAARGLCAACAARPKDATLVLTPPSPTPSPNPVPYPGSNLGSTPARPEASAAVAPSRLGWLAVLRSIDRKRKGTVIPLEGPVAVVSRPPKSSDGALEGQGIVFEDDFISFSHLRFARVGDGYELEVGRKGSSKAQNPAYVNEKEVRAGSRVSLRNGDRIEVGATWLEFRTLRLP